MMKFKNVFAAALPLLAVAGAVVSCNDYDNGYSEKALVYAQEFETTYGSVDPDQDWNLAMRGSVTVTVAKPSKVTIYALVNGIYSIVGDYADVTATQKLEFDVLEGTTQLIVTDGTQGIHTTVGGSVSFGGGSQAHTRAANYGNNLKDKNEQVTDISVTTTGEYITFTREEAKKYESVLPEIDDPSKPYDESNLNRTINNFKYVSNGSFTFYPVYWQTSAANEVGIYYTDAQGQYHEVRVYDIKSGDELLNVYADGRQEPVASLSSIQGYNENWGVVNQRAKAITIDIPEGTVFGFYLINNGTHKFYSEAEKNHEYIRYEDHRGEKACYAASVTIDGSKYLCFEDWYEGDFDLNDVVFKFAGNVPTTIDEDLTAASWIVACEDLGGSFDWDFNDVIFKVAHISGQETATITPLAAGGTLASYIFFDNPNTPNAEETCLGEIHQLIGSGACASGEYNPYNVYNTRGTAGQSFTIPVDKDWTMAYYSSESFIATEQYKEHNMGGFSIRVLKEETPAKDKYLSIKDPDFGLASIVAAPGQGDAPQMICLPATYELGEWTYEWAWSKELQTMADGQGNGSYPRFAGWVNDHNTNVDWYKYPNDNPVTTVAENKWKTSSTEPEPVKKTTPTIGGVPSLDWSTFTGGNLSGNQIFVVPSGSQLKTALDVDGKEYPREGKGTFTITIDDAGTGSTAGLASFMNRATLCIDARGNKEAIVTVNIAFSGDDEYNATSVTYTVLIPKKVYLTSQANGDEWALTIKDGTLCKEAGFKLDKAIERQAWYILPIVDAKGNLVDKYKDYFWLCNADTKQFVTINGDTKKAELTSALPANEVPNRTIPVGAQNSYFTYDSNHWLSVFKYTTAWSFAIINYGNFEVAMLDNREEANQSKIITFIEK